MSDTELIAALTEKLRWLMRWPTPYGRVGEVMIGSIPAEAINDLIAKAEVRLEEPK